MNPIDQIKRIAACYFREYEMTLILVPSNNIDHKLTFYFLDWDKRNITGYIQICDYKNDEILHQQKIEDYQDGIYITYDFRGVIKAKIIMEYFEIWFQRRYGELFGIRPLPKHARTWYNRPR